MVSVSRSAIAFAMLGRLGLALVLLAGTAALARADLVALFGDERVGTSGGQFLRVPSGARPMAMGGGMTATVEGPNAVFWNPAGMRIQREKHGFFISHLEYAADIDIDHIAYVRRSSIWQVGVGLGVLRSGEIVRTTEFHPSGTGQTFEANQFLASLSIGRMLTDRFTLAATVKMLQENLDDYENRGVFVDVGALYNTGYNNARIGFAVRNFGGDMKLNGDPPAQAGLSGSWQSFPAPTVAVFGFAYDIGNATARHMTLSLDLGHPSDESEIFVFGSELAAGRGLFLRSGYRTGVDNGGLSAGFGLRFNRWQFPAHVDYGVVDRGPFGVLHTLSLELRR